MPPRAESHQRQDVNVKVTHVDEHWVCGTFGFLDLTPKGREQAFAARVVHVATDR